MSEPTNQLNYQYSSIIELGRELLDLTEQFKCYEVKLIYDLVLSSKGFSYYDYISKDWILLPDLTSLTDYVISVKDLNLSAEDPVIRVQVLSEVANSIRSEIAKQKRKLKEESLNKRLIFDAE